MTKRTERRPGKRAEVMFAIDKITKSIKARPNSKELFLIGKKQTLNKAFEHFIPQIEELMQARFSRKEQAEILSSALSRKIGYSNYSILLSQYIEKKKTSMIDTEDAKTETGIEQSQEGGPVHEEDSVFEEKDTPEELSSETDDDSSNIFEDTEETGKIAETETEQEEVIVPGHEENSVSKEDEIPEELSSGTDDNFDHEENSVPKEKDTPKELSSDTYEDFVNIFDSINETEKIREREAEQEQKEVVDYEHKEVLETEEEAVLSDNIVLEDDITEDNPIEDDAIEDTNTSIAPFNIFSDDDDIFGDEEDDSATEAEETLLSFYEEEDEENELAVTDSSNILLETERVNVDYFCSEENDSRHDIVDSEDLANSLYRILSKYPYTEKNKGLNQNEDEARKQIINEVINAIVGTECEKISPYVKSSMEKISNLIAENVKNIKYYSHEIKSEIVSPMVRQLLLRGMNEDKNIVTARQALMDEVPSMINSFKEHLKESFSVSTPASVMFGAGGYILFEDALVKAMISEIKESTDEKGGINSSILIGTLAELSEKVNDIKTSIAETANEEYSYEPENKIIEAIEKLSNSFSELSRSVVDIKTAAQEKEEKEKEEEYVGDIENPKTNTEFLQTLLLKGYTKEDNNTPGRGTGKKAIKKAIEESERRITETIKESIEKSSKFTPVRFLKAAAIFIAGVAAGIYLIQMPTVEKGKEDVISSAQSYSMPTEPTSQRVSLSQDDTARPGE